MTPNPTASNLALLLVAVALAVLPASAQAGDLASNGTFRFLTQDLPDGTTNAEYVARLLAANADGPVTFDVSELPPGMSLDPQSGFITGRPTATYNKDITLRADDGTQIIQLDVNLKVNASGGGGNEGSSFSNSSLAQGRVGQPYSETLSVDNGVGPFVFGAANLPPGLTLDGLTGALSGSPNAAGTYFTSLSVHDFGEDNKGVKVLPLTVLPVGSDFRFTTSMLNNGEVGTPFCETLLTTDASGPVTYFASGLPPGLTLDSATGEISGTPTQAGSFPVTVSANDSSDTIATNLAMILVPSSASAFYWEFFGVPAALINESYDRQPPILVATANGTTVTYSVTGLPAGMSYNSTTGELTGTSTEVAEYPLLFTATDTTSGETLTLPVEFLVLPPNGGDPSQIMVNLWIGKEKLKTGTGGRDTWGATAIYNADRRTGNAFDPATDTLVLTIGSKSIQLDPGSLAGTSKSYSFKSPSGDVPTESVKLSPTKQDIKWSSKNNTLAEAVPGMLTHIITLGNRSWRLDGQIDEKGTFRPATGVRRPAFVLAKGKISLKGAGSDSATFSFLLADPSFFYDPGVSTLRFRLLDGPTVLVDRDFTSLGTGSTSVDNQTGMTLYSIKTLKDEAVNTLVKKFGYKSKAGKMGLGLSALDLSALTAPEVHLTFELTIGARLYVTSVTFFAKGTSSYSTAMP